jgi:signal transduction histidine kinase/PAS domain-containing protein
MMPLPKAISNLMPCRLGRRLQLTLSLGIGLVIAAFGAWTIHGQSAQAVQNLQAQAAALARDIALASENPVLTDKLDVVEEMLLRSAFFPEVRDLRAIDLRGQALSHVTHEPGQAPKVQFDPPQARTPMPASAISSARFDESSGSVVAWHPIMAGNLLGWVRLEYGTDGLGEMRSSIWTSTAVASLLAVLGSVGLWSLLLARPVRAIDRATDIAVGLNRIEGQQLDVPTGPVEIVELCRALNQASANLHEQRLAIDVGIDALHLNKSTLADTNEQLSTLFALSPDALVSFNAAGRIGFANDALFRILDIDANALLGQPASMLDDLFRQHCDDPGHYPGLDCYFTQGSPFEAVLGPAEAHARRRQRAHLVLTKPRLQVLEVVGRLGYSPSVSRLLYLRDVTHESEVDRMKSDFLATAAHELRTPMTSIHACLELMQMPKLTDARRQQLVGVAARHSTTMVNIVNELLDLARIESQGSADFVFTRVELREVLAQGLRDFVQPEGREAPQLLAQGASKPVRVDQAKLLQVVRNLVSNAFKYSSDGLVTVQLLTAQPGPRGLRVGFQVVDRGIGMTPEQLARVGERFYRADASGHVLGTGLGMSIVQELIGLMDGTLELLSEPGQGTTVTVWLPQAPALEGASGQDAATGLGTTQPQAETSEA